MREIRDIKFGTRGPVMYNDLFYGTDLEVRAFGTFSIQITDAKQFIRNFLPPNVTYYTFDSAQARSQIVTEFLQSLLLHLILCQQLIVFHNYPHKNCSSCGTSIK